MSEFRAGLAAVGFLTRLPIPRQIVLDAVDVQRAGAYFPLVGAALGAGTGALSEALGRRVGPQMGGALSTAAATLATSALHLDALGDLADASGAQSRERALEIMRDPRLGAFGVTAIASDLVIKTAALAALVDRGRSVRGATAAGALSRSVPVVLGAALPYVRPGGGTGDAMTQASGERAAAAGATGAAIALAMLGRDGLSLALGTAAITALARVGLKRWLGGVTGDGLGASLELTETALLVGAVASAR